MKDKIKVLNIIIEDRIGGPQLRIIQVAAKLKEKGIKTIVAIPANKGGFQELLKKENIKFYEIPHFRRPRLTFNPIEHLKYFFSFVPAVLKLRRIIKSESINIVHQNDPKQIQGSIAAKLSNVKVLWHLQGMTYSLLSKPFILFVYFLADKVVASSTEIGVRYFNPRSRFFRRDVETLYAPVDTSRHRPGIDPKEFIREFGLSNAKPVIGMIGNLNSIKGHKYFVQAARMIKDKYSNARFLIIGKILENRLDYIRKLKETAVTIGLEGDVVFTGERHDIPQVLSAMDIFVLPSLSEGCPMVLLEAMATSLPCIASNVGGVPEVIGDNKAGLLVPPKDPKAIYEAVDFLCNNPDKAKAMGEMGRKRVVSDFALNLCVDNHYRLYTQMVRQKD